MSAEVRHQLVLSFTENGGDGADVLRSETASVLTKSERALMVASITKHGHACYRILSSVGTGKPSDWPKLTDDEVKQLIPTVIEHLRGRSDGRQWTREILANEKAVALLSKEQSAELKAIIGH